MRKILITIFGGLLLILGIVLLPLPGPGVLVIFVALSVLGVEYVWARKRIRWLRDRVSRVGKSKG